jgi:hypothetical protein
MRNMPKPNISAELSYGTSISRVRTQDLRSRLQSIVPKIIDASVRFEESATGGTITSITRTTSVGEVTGDELRAVYKGRFAKLGSPGRIHYDRIFTSAPNGKCPLCAHRDVTTLDHFLPQAHYPGLVVAPLNLIPACSDCNRTKLDATPVSGETATLHPYFDDVDGDEWLVASVRETQPASVVFRVLPPPTWPSVLAARVENHFQVFGLAALYAAQAAEELINMRFLLQKLFDASGVVAVTSHLAETAASRAQAHTNSWQTAAYKAFASSPWFCEGGFAEAL